MSAQASSKAKLSLPIVAVLTAGAFALGGVAFALVALFTLLGAPLFSVMGAGSMVGWFLNSDPGKHHLRFVAAEILTDRFSESPILITIPLFTFVGYVLAESKTPDRLVRAASALVGWLPGGLAIVCVIASSVFTVLTGGSGVTIIAVGGLLYPALRQQGYSDKFSLGLITTGGSLGLLLPLSLPILVYSLVAGIDFNKAFIAGLVPAALVTLMLAAYSMYVGVKNNIPRQEFSPQELIASLWAFKWELIIFVLLVGCLVSGFNLDEVAGIVALYTVFAEFVIQKDLSFKKDFARIAKSSMALAGAVILILAMANALINWVGIEQIPDRLLEFMLKLGLTKTWQFLLILNVFLIVLGMVMDGFSAILVAVPLVVPFAARFALGPFHLAMIMILNLEVALCCPPLGLNIFLSSFRFNRPVVSLYRIVVPFIGILTVALLLVSYIPWLSEVTIYPHIDKARAAAAEKHEAPRDAWALECVQQDHLNPLPCTEADKKAFPNGQMPVVEEVKPEVKDSPGDDDDELMKKMMGGDAKKEAAGGDDDDELMKKMMGGGETATDAGAKPEKKLDEDEELLKKMMQ